MISLKNKQEIILKSIRENKSQRQIHRETGIARETIRKYVKEYEEELKNSANRNENIEKVDIIESLISKPTYKSSPRTKRVMNDDVINKLKAFLKENEQKRLTGFSKQQMKKIDMYEALVEDGFNVSYTSVAKAVNSIERKQKEAYIRQEYNPGDVVEFDFGLVKLMTSDGYIREYQLAVFTSAYGNYRWARLFPKQDTACFLESHALFFEHIGGAYKTVVYDNTRVAVKKFVGHSIKEPTDALLKLSLYYKFYFRFCNICSGNEKGHVERSVEYIRRKAFSKDIIFDSLDDANNHLNETLLKLNSRKPNKSKKTAIELLNDEKEYLLPKMPIFETSKIADFRVNKYSTVMIDSCYYSVPDKYVGVMVRCKIYSTKILIFYDEEKIAEHSKVIGLNKWSLDINHYVYTLLHKPKALVNSTAFKQLNIKLKDIYSTYFTNENKDFVKLLVLVGDYGLDKVEDAIAELNFKCPQNISIDKIEFICDRKNDDTIIFSEDYNSDIVTQSVKMLNDFNNLL